MKKLLHLTRIITLILLCSYLFAFAVQSPEAGSATINDTTLDPDYDINIGDAHAGPACDWWVNPPGNALINADTFTLEVSQTGDYDVSGEAPDGSSFSKFINPAIYDGPYSELNCVDSFFGYGTEIDTWSLQAGVVYLLVIGAETGSVDGDGADYTFSISGPGNVYIDRSAQPAPQAGMISISTAQAQPVYESAGGGVVRDAGGNELWLPQDYDGNGFDTHLVMSSTEIDGRTWYEIWIGESGSTVWVPADKVTVVE